MEGNDIADIFGDVPNETTELRRTIAELSNELDRISDSHTGGCKSEKRDKHAAQLNKRIDKLSKKLSKLNKTLKKAVKPPKQPVFGKWGELVLKKAVPCLLGLALNLLFGRGGFFNRLQFAPAK